MDKRLTVRLAALADVAEAVAGLKETLGASGDRTNGLFEAMYEIARDLLGGAIVSDPDAPAADDKPGRAAAARGEASHQAVKKAVAAKKAKAGGGSADGKCVICGKAFERRSASQKACSQECVKEKNRRYAAQKYRAAAAAAKTKKAAPAGQGFRMPTDPIPQSVRDAAREARAADRMD